MTKKEGTLRPRLVCVVHTRFPAVLAGSRPLRNSLVRPVGIAAGRSRPRAACGASVRPLTPVLGHARFPLDPAPLLGAPEGPRVPSTRLPAWISEEFVPQDLRVVYRSEVNKPVERSLLRLPCAAGSRASSALRDHGEP